MFDRESSENLLGELVKRDETLFGMFPLVEFEALLDETPHYELYNFKTDKVQAWWAAIEQQYGTEAIALYNRVLLLHLLSRFEVRAVGKTYPDTILNLFDVEFARIIDRVREEADSRFAADNDLFLKDLGICRQQLVPCGNILNEEAGLPRSILWKGGIAQFFRYAWFLLVAGRGRKPWYEGHLHLDAVDFSYSKEARQEARLRVVDMLIANPHVKGKVGYSWYNDPALENISPALGFERRLYCAKGGWLFRIGPDTSGMAFVRSETRRRLHKEGKYEPTVYMIIWPRRKMIKWAKESAQG